MWAMVAIARRAGVSTKTMYRLVPTKAELFRNLIADRISRFMVALDLDALDHLAPVDALTRLLTSYGEMTLGEEAVAMYRLAITEAEAFSRDCVLPLRRGDRARRAGLWTPGYTGNADRENSAWPIPGWPRDFCAACWRWSPSGRTLLRQRPLPDTAQIAARAKACAELFLNGCRVD